MGDGGEVAREARGERGLRRRRRWRHYLLDVDGRAGARGAEELAAIVALEYGRCPVHREDVQEGIGYCTGGLVL